MKFSKIKYQLVKFIENIPLLQIFIYNNLEKFKFLFPHDKDYLALNLLFNKSETRDFMDIGGNIGLSTIGFRELGFKQNKIHIFEPDNFLINNYLSRIKKVYKNLIVHNFGLSSKNSKKKLFKAFYKNNYFHFNNSFDKSYIKNKIRENYPEIYKNFTFKSEILKLKKYDSLNLKLNPCFIKIDVEGLDHLVLKGMMKLINKTRPVILIEYNHSNFKNIYNFTKKKYDCYIYNIDTNKLVKLKLIDIKKLLKGQILERKYVKNSVNLFYINKKIKL
tara:strand:- start:1083 stop:1910 length:828 start_codon:yes stop_codon:yes gene_type:complete